MTDLNADRFDLDTAETLPASDDRELTFTVKDGDNNPVDISSATIEWYLMDRAWDVDADAAQLTHDSDAVTIVTSGEQDPQQGEFAVEIEPVDLWGDLWHFPRVITGGETSTWRGEVHVEDV